MKMTQSAWKTFENTRLEQFLDAFQVNWDALEKNRFDLSLIKHN